MNVSPIDGRRLVKDSAHNPMVMTRSNFLCMTGIVAAGVVACVIVQHRLQGKLDEGERLRKRQEEQLAVLTREHERLSTKVVVSQRESRDMEVSRLRQEAEALKARTNILAGQLKEAAASAPPPVPPLASRPPEYWEERRKLAGNKPTEAVILASAFVSYASDHDSQCPADLEQLYAYMAEQQSRPWSGSNQFEMIFHGSLEKLKGIPLDTVAVIREKSSWPGPDGTKTRVYGMASGSSQMLESNDDFKAWEAEHLIAP